MVAAGQAVGALSWALWGSVWTDKTVTICIVAPLLPAELRRHKRAFLKLATKVGTQAVRGSAGVQVAGGHQQREGFRVFRYVGTCRLSISMT
jgi:hypothetical protein